MYVQHDKGIHINDRSPPPPPSSTVMRILLLLIWHILLVQLNIPITLRLLCQPLFGKFSRGSGIFGQGNLAELTLNYRYRDFTVASAEP